MDQLLWNQESDRKKQPKIIKRGKSINRTRTCEEIPTDCLSIFIIMCVREQQRVYVRRRRWVCLPKKWNIIKSVWGTFLVAHTAWSAMRLRLHTSNADDDGGHVCFEKPVIRSDDDGRPPGGFMAVINRNGRHVINRINMEIIEPSVQLHCQWKHY